MTPAGRAAYTLFALLLIPAFLQGSAHLHAGSLRQAAPFYLVAAACLVGMCREASRTDLDDPGEPERAPAWWPRLRATFQARAILRAARCTCDAAWWPSDQHPHAPYCRCARKRSCPE